MSGRFWRRIEANRFYYANTPMQWETLVALCTNIPIWRTRIRYIKADLSGIMWISQFIIKTDMEKKFWDMAAILTTDHAIIISVEMGLFMVEIEIHLPKCRK